MDVIFLRVLNLSITAGWLILAVMLLRLLLKNAPKWVRCLLWGIVGVRLVVPFSLESVFSLIPSAETVPLTITTDPTPSIHSGVPLLNSVVNPVLSEVLTPTPQNSANPMQIVTLVAAVVWVVGMVGMLLYAGITYWRLHRKLRTAVPLYGNLRQSEAVSSPFILGCIRPKIYLPYHLEGDALRHVIAHEQAHLKRYDHLLKPVAFLILAVYWFTPLIWVAYVLLCRDIELACDERVIRSMEKEERQNYSMALVQNSVERRRITACPLAFGEVGVKERVKRVMNYKKPAFWLILVAVIACIAVAVGFLTTPATPPAKDTPIYSFNATVLSLDGGLLVRPFEGEDELRSSDQIYVSTDLASDGTVPTLQVGSSIRIVYDGQIAESYPAQILKVFAIDLLSGSISNVGGVDPPTAPGSSSVSKWFDYLVDSDGMNWSGSLEINLPEFSEVTFRWYPEKIEAVTEDGITPLYTGMPIWNTYFTDLTGDGLPELCSTLSMGSGIVDTHVIIYDYANGVNYSLEDRMNFDYTLWQNGSDGQLYVDKTSYAGGELVSFGRLAIKDNGIQILGETTVSSSVDDSVDPSDTSEVEESEPEVEVVYETRYSDIGYSEEGFGLLRQRALNKDTFDVSSRRHEPILRVDSRAELDAFKAEFSDYFHFFRSGYTTIPPFENQTKGYGEAFFENYSLFLIGLTEPSGSISHRVSGITCQNGRFEVVIDRILPEIGTSDMAGWLIIVPVEKQAIADCTAFDAYIGRDILPVSSTDNPDVSEVEESEPEVEKAPPSTVKGNTTTILEIVGNRIIVDAKGHYIHCNDAKYRDYDRLAFDVSTATGWKVGDAVAVIHTGVFTEGDPPVGELLDFVKA